MHIITSFENQKIKYISSLNEKKHRLQNEEYIAEGLLWVKDAIKHFNANNSCKITYIAVMQSMYEKYKPFILSLDDKILVLDDKIFNKISQEKNSQGILAVIKANTAQSVKSNYCIFLDRIRDPGNLGTIFRTAVAAGFNDILCYDCVDTYNPKVIRSSMSAVLNLNIVNANYNYLNDLKSDGYKIICADIKGQNIFKSNEMFSKICLVIGNEANGISSDIKKTADLSYCIPMEKIESLNASVSAGILMYLLKYKGV